MCGSSRFEKIFVDVELDFIQKGAVVLTPVFVSEVNLTLDLAKLLGKMHLKKIELADEIFVIDVDGYIGESTKKEIAYAKEKKLPVRYYSEEYINIE